MDWTFTYTDATIAALPQGEPRIDVDLAGDEVASVARYIYVPEEWERQQRAASTRNIVIQIATSVVFGGLLLSAAIGGMIRWSRGQYAPRVFLAATALVLVASAIDIVNGWPSVLASLTTSAPLQIQVLGVIAVGFIGLAPAGRDHRARDRRAACHDWPAWRGWRRATRCVSASPPDCSAPPPARWRARCGHRRGRSSPRSDRSAASCRSWRRRPIPVTGFLTRLAVMGATFLTIDRMTGSWTRRRHRRRWGAGRDRVPVGRRAGDRQHRRAGRWRGR